MASHRRVIQKGCQIGRIGINLELETLIPREVIVRFIQFYDETHLTI